MLLQRDLSVHSGHNQPIWICDIDFRDHLRVAVYAKRSVRSFPQNFGPSISHINGSSNAIFEPSIPEPEGLTKRTNLGQGPTALPAIGCRARLNRANVCMPSCHCSAKKAQQSTVPHGAQTASSVRATVVFCSLPLTATLRKRAELLQSCHASEPRQLRWRIKPGSRLLTSTRRYARGERSDASTRRAATRLEP